MAKVVTVTNQKGGVGKTSTTEMLATSLKRLGYRVLCVDFDPQGNLGFSVGADTERFPTIYEVLRGSAKPAAAIQKTGPFDLIAANILLSGVELEFTQRDREFLLKNALASVLSQYDYIFIDTPPGLGVLTVNAFAASDAVLIPALADIFSLKGVVELHDSIRRVKLQCNPELYVSGIVLVRYNPRSDLAKSIRETAGRVAKDIGTRVFDKAIRTSSAISEAQALQTDVFEYAPKSLVVQDYRKLTQEFLERGFSGGN